MTTTQNQADNLNNQPNNEAENRAENRANSQSSDGGSDASVAEKEALAHKIFIRDLVEKQSFQSWFLVREKSKLTGKNGKTYLSLYLIDKTGAIDARIWDNVDQVNETFQSGDVVRVKGQLQVFQNRKQVIIHRIEKMQMSDVNLDDLVSRSKREPTEMMAELLGFAEAVQDRGIRQLILDVLTDPEVRSLLLRAPAAKSIHHAYEGGLLEHILSICGMMKMLHGHYTAQGVALKLDLLIFGAIFHDIGKIWELDARGSVTYSDKGKLLGHMLLAVELIEKKSTRILGFSEETKDLLKHIVLSHHGRMEYGSPRVPMFLEAFIVAAIDDLDSKINSIEVFLRAERDATLDPEARWSRFSPLFERHFLLKT